MNEPHPMMPALTGLRPVYGRRSPPVAVSTTRARSKRLPRTISQRRSEAGWRNPVGWIFAALFLHLSIVDTIWAESIPMINPSRVLVPAALMIIFLFERKARRGGVHLAVWIALITAAGALSSVEAFVPSLGFLKLAIYVSVLVPLCLSRSLRTAFMPDACGFPLLGAAALALLVASVVAWPITASGVYDNPNKLGMLAVCIWPALMLETRQLSRTRSVLGWIGLLLCAGLCLAGWSRGGLMGLAAGVAAYTALRYSPTIRSLLVAAVVVGLFGLMLYTFGEWVKDFAYKGRDTILGSGREMVMLETLHAWTYRPMLGYGFGLSWTLTPEDAEMVWKTGRMSWFSLEFGNSTLAMLSGGGAVLAVLMYGMIAHVLLRGFNSLRVKGASAQHREMQLAVVAAIIGLCVHAQAEAWLMAPLTWPTLLFWFYVGLSTELSARLKPAAPTASRAGPAQRPIRPASASSGQGQHS